MGYAVCHVEKNKGSVGGLQGHIDRELGKERTYKNADPTRTRLNRDLTDPYYAGLRLDKAVAARIGDGYRATKRDSSGELAPAPIRKDAVKSFNMILGGSHKEMIEIFSKPDKGQAWIDANMVFLDKAYGKENIVKLVLHLDEKTPHLHAVIVPLTKDGRLSAKEIIGNAQKLSTLQTLHAHFMQPFGLERGIEGSKAAHITAGEFQAKIITADLETSQPVEITRLNVIDAPKINLRVAQERMALVQKFSEATMRAEIAERRAEKAENLLVGLKEKARKTSELANRLIEELKKSLDILLYRASGRRLKPEYEKDVNDLLDHFKKETLDPIDKRAAATAAALLPINIARAHISEKDMKGEDRTAAEILNEALGELRKIHPREPFNFSKEESASLMDLIKDEITSSLEEVKEVSQGAKVRR